MIDSAVRWRIAAGSVASITAAIGLAGIVAPRWDAGGQELLEGWALLAVLCAPAAFALLSFAARPTLLLAGAILALATSPLLGILAPILWVFAAVYAQAFARQHPRGSVAPTWAVVVVPVVLVLVGGALILGSTEMMCVTTGSAQECGETTTRSGSTAALVIVGLAVAAALGLSSPRRPADSA